MKHIPLSKGLFATVDAADYERLICFKWHSKQSRNHGFYATRNQTNADGTKTKILMHREILDLAGTEICDHIDSNGLNNQRQNLRKATREQNARNRRQQLGSSRFKGVSWNKTRRKWRAQICVNGRKLFIGRFRDEVKAAIAYDASAIKHHGEFANLNFKEAGFEPVINKEPKESR